MSCNSVPSNHWKQLKVILNYFTFVSLENNQKINAFVYSINELKYLFKKPYHIGVENRKNHKKTS